MIETQTTLVTTGLDVYIFFKTECYIMKKVDTSSVRNIKRGFVVCKPQQTIFFVSMYFFAQPNSQLSNLSIQGNLKGRAKEDTQHYFNPSSTQFHYCCTSVALLHALSISVLKIHYCDRGLQLVNTFRRSTKLYIPSTLLLNEGIPRALKGKKLRLKIPRVLPSIFELFLVFQI